MSPFIIRRPDGTRIRVRLDGGASWAHPDVLGEALDALRPPEDDPKLSDWYYLRDAVDLIWHIAEHPAGTESIVAQVRQYRRRIKADRENP